MYESVWIFFFDMDHFFKKSDTHLILGTFLLHLIIILNNLLTLYWCSLFEKTIEMNWICLPSPKPDTLPGCATPRLLSFIGYTGLFINWKMFECCYLWTYVDQIPSLFYPWNIGWFYCSQKIPSLELSNRMPLPCCQWNWKTTTI